MRAPKDLRKAVARYKFLEACFVFGRCTVVTLVRGELIGAGLARCLPGDTWNSAFGHRVARSKALLDFAQKVHERRTKAAELNVDSAERADDGCIPAPTADQLRALRRLKAEFECLSRATGMKR